MAGFSVDEIAKDTLKLINTIKATKNDTVILFGRGFGSYIAHRMLQIDSTQISSVILDGLCIGKYCNASDWDIQRDIMGRAILSKVTTADMNQTIAHQHYTSTNMNPTNSYISLLKAGTLSLPVCGRSLRGFTTGVREKSTVSMFDQTLRPGFFASTFFLNRCQVNDYGNGLTFFFKQGKS